MERIRFPYFVLAFSILLTVGVTFIFYQSAKNKDDTRFNNGVNRIHSAMENRIALYVALLKAGRGFVESSTELNRKKFAGFVESLELKKNYFGAQGIGYSKVIAPGEREALILQMRSQGFNEFRVFPETQSQNPQAIIYFEPLDERNRQALGYDMSTEENRRTALERARDSGQAVATSKLILLQENEEDRQFGFLIYLPVYKNGELPQTVEGRKQNLQGFIYSPFRASNFLKDVQNNAGTNDIAIKIYDGETGPERLLAQTGAPDGQNLLEKNSGQYTTQNEIEIAGRRWVIEYDSLPAFALQSSVNWTPLIFLCGVIFSFLLFGMTYWESATRAKLQSTADDLTESESQIQGLLEKEQKARQLAEYANSTKDEFISVVSHELRTPLNAIAGWTRILKSEELSTNTKELALQKIEKNLRLQTNLVEDLLNFSQIVSSKGDFEKTEIDCSEVFESVFREIESAAVHKGISISKENRLNGQKILGEFDRIKIVFTNLLSNAVKFTPSNGEIKARLRQQEDSIELTVEDSGRGISPEFLPYIFDRFRQDDSSTTRKFGGLGLGLAVTEHIVKLHNGSIEARSEGEGKGSTFVVRFPVYKR